MRSLLLQGFRVLPRRLPPSPVWGEYGLRRVCPAQRYGSSVRFLGPGPRRHCGWPVSSAGDRGKAGEQGSAAPDGKARSRSRGPGNVLLGPGRPRGQRLALKLVKILNGETLQRAAGPRGHVREAGGPRRWGGAAAGVRGMDCVGKTEGFEGGELARVPSHPEGQRLLS